ncbi:UvrD-helicase domain-containing protein [Virgibacillus dakarensis]|nr:UvrD-helicase domain-containing protein [Virgibacillus dakarensis]
MTSLELLETITPEILPMGFTFSDKQKPVIIADGSANIVAGPGSGKTTVLIAKCALLIKQNLNSNKGICLITHTNVAVDEIKAGLKKVGIDDIEYPNFIGTIQEFFNTFFTKKAFHLLHGEKKFRVLDDEEYQEKFNELFQKRKPEWYTYSSPGINRANPKIKVSGDLIFHITSNANQSYKNVFEGCIQTLFSQGFVNNIQCLELTKWYIERYERQIITAIQNRFKYVLLDETQDTSLMQYDLLKRLFSNQKVSFQKFGDPYQALYNIFEGNEDAWIPSKETDVRYYEVSETSRFGTSIANILKNVCIEKYDIFQSLDLVQSFNPYYIVFENEKDLLLQYRGLISSCEGESELFSQSKRKDAIISTFHGSLARLFSEYIKPSASTKPGRSESTVKKTYNFLVGLLSQEIGSSFMDLKEKVDECLNCRIRLSKCIKQIINRNSTRDSIISNLEEVLKHFTDKCKAHFSIVNVDIQIKHFRQSFINASSEVVKTPSSEFHIGTIHSVKGETHRSTLLVLNTIFEDFSGGNVFSMFNLLKEYLVGSYIDPNHIVNEMERNETIKSLKLAYVAMSRPTHLMAIALPAYLVSEDDDILKRMNDNGWRRYEQSSGVIEPSY